MILIVEAAVDWCRTGSVILAGFIAATKQAKGCLACN